MTSPSSTLLALSTFYFEDDPAGLKSPSFHSVLLSPLNASGKQRLRLLEFRSPLCTEPASGSIDEVGQHPQTGYSPFGRHPTRRQSPCNRGRTLGEQTRRRMSRICLDFRCPSALLLNWHPRSLDHRLEIKGLAGFCRLPFNRAVFNGPHPTD
jgi:hypothetical protein